MAYKLKARKDCCILYGVTCLFFKLFYYENNILKQISYDSELWQQHYNGL